MSEKPKPLIERVPPLTLEDMRTIYRRRIAGKPAATDEIVDRMLVTLFWFVEKRELPKGQTLTGKEWET